MLWLALAAGIAGLAPGATVRLAPGDHDLIAINGQRFDPPVTIDANGASVRGLQIYDSQGIVWKGGTISAPQGKQGAGPNFYGVDMRRSKSVTFDNVTFTNALRGMVVADSRGLIVRNSRFAGLRSDGMDVAGTSDVLIEKNSFTDFTPNKPTGDKKAGNWVDGDHPDAVQMWATKDGPAPSDIIIRNNVVDGDTQGFTTFGPHGDGYNRIRIENNKLKTNYPAGIAVLYCSDCSVRGNSVAPQPGAKFKSNINVGGSTGAFCGNQVASVPHHPTAKSC